MANHEKETNAHPVQDGGDHVYATYFVTLKVPITISATKGSKLAVSMTTGDHTSVVFCHAVAGVAASEIEELQENGLLECMISDINPDRSEAMEDAKDLPGFAKYLDGGGISDQPFKVVSPLTGEEDIIKRLDARIAYDESQIDMAEEGLPYLKSFLNGQINGFQIAIYEISKNQPTKSE